MTNAPRKTARVLAREQALAQMADEARGRGSIGFVAKQVRGGIQLIEHLDMYRSKFVQLSLDGEPREETIREWDYRHLPAFRCLKGSREIGLRRDCCSIRGLVSHIHYP